MIKNTDHEVVVSSQQRTKQGGGMGTKKINKIGEVDFQCVSQSSKLDPFRFTLDFSATSTRSLEILIKEFGILKSAQVHQSKV